MKADEGSGLLIVVVVGVAVGAAKARLIDNICHRVVVTCSDYFHWIGCFIFVVICCGCHTCVLCM
jgi:hypothetical protein